MIHRLPFLVLCGAALLLPAAPAQAQPAWTLEVESGAAFPGYNDIRIPGDTGTLFSFSEELETDPTPYIRLRLTRRLGARHSLGLLVAPLQLDASGSLDRPLDFAGTTFPAGTPLEGRYRFDSYRLIYRWAAIQRETFRGEIGLTAKIRDAAIRVSGGGLAAEKKNTGLVPLISFRADWMWRAKWHLLVDGDALAAPQGRAEDVLAALRYDLHPRAAVHLGYRILEGGADNDEVYTFTLVHFAAAGVAILF